MELLVSPSSTSVPEAPDVREMGRAAFQLVAWKSWQGTYEIEASNGAGAWGLFRL